jgi:N-acetylglucosaminyldiphosphoundecaprenol N-acetyl-beta-D-mannosaminyltransferase
MPPDFSREVHCLLGLPFDAVNLAVAEQRIRDAADKHSACFLSTPNLNFLIAAQSDIAFRKSVINSDLSVADGMPLVWISRLLGIPIRERVAGSALFESLRTNSGKPLSIFFFGGPEGAAEAACRQLNNESGGLTCAGFESPGFGSVEEMSSEEIIARINASKADFLVVSLGAKKGQAWIEHNRPRITVPVISHLGAVVNFVAGTVKRAPVGMQKIGLEWLWRIKEDPALWRRYASDGAGLLRLVVTHVIPYAWLIYWRKPSISERDSASFELVDDGKIVLIRLHGVWLRENLKPLRECFSKLTLAGKDVQLELEDVTYVDSAFIGLLLLLHGVRTHIERRLIKGNLTKNVRNIFRYACAEFLLEAS